MPDRFFHRPPLQSGLVRLDGPEAHHLIHVMRAEPGLEVVLFDGSGAEFPAWVERVERTTVELIAEERRDVDRELPVLLTLGVALPKGDRQQWLVEKVTELGVARLIPLVTARGVAKPAAASIARLERGVIEACKQCGRNRLMEIAPPRTWDEFVSNAPRDNAVRLVAHPGGEPIRDAGCAAPAIWLAVGPEGGFTNEEIQQAIAAGWRAVDLGARLLRTETAAVAMVAAVTLSRP